VGRVELSLGSKTVRSGGGEGSQRH
jgi:hypothetical protein